MSDLIPLPSTFICPTRAPRRLRQKWLICENGEPITTAAALFRASAEEAAMLVALRKEFRGQNVVSRPDIASDGGRCRFEIHLETEVSSAVMAEVALEVPKRIGVQTEMNL
ncbi:MAG: hypothetical protein JWP57_4655 [Spirosoma sp.]|nr:hypothetical protein [Spirosoma sp.]